MHHFACGVVEALPGVPAADSKAGEDKGESSGRAGPPADTRTDAQKRCGIVEHSAIHGSAERASSPAALCGFVPWRTEQWFECAGNGNYSQPLLRCVQVRGEVTEAPQTGHQEGQVASNTRGEGPAVQRIPGQPLRAPRYSKSGWVLVTQLRRVGHAQRVGQRDAAVAAAGHRRGMA